MSKKRNAITALPSAYIVWTVSFAALLILSALICSMTGDPLKYTGISAKAVIILCAAAGGTVVRKKGGTFLQGMIFSASVFAALLLISLFGNGSTACYITDAVCFAASLISFFIPSLFKQKRHRRKR